MEISLLLRAFPIISKKSLGKLMSFPRDLKNWEHICWPAPTVYKISLKAKLILHYESQTISKSHPPVLYFLSLLYIYISNPVLLLFLCYVLPSLNWHYDPRVHISMCGGSFPKCQKIRRWVWVSLEMSFF